MNTQAPIKAPETSLEHQVVQISNFAVLVPKGFAVSIDDVEWDEDNGMTELTLSFTRSFVSAPKEQTHGS